MPQVVIENPILNSPFEEPRRHYRFDEDGITDQIAEERRKSSYFIRQRVALWRDRGYSDITPVTRGLLEYWQRKDRERRLFFC